MNYLINYQNNDDSSLCVALKVLVYTIQCVAIILVFILLLFINEQKEKKILAMCHESIYTNIFDMTTLTARDFIAREIEGQTTFKLNEYQSTKLWSIKH